ncbi:MAG: MFS transporter [Planctomycetes bacterium]|nr:MFS transporter [Planctomycetota bacterium]
MNFQRDGIAPNAGRLLWAGFFAILAAGVGFAIRAGIINDWRGDFGFTDQQIGTITTAGFPGFCVGIIAGGLVCDRLGYRMLILAAFAFHLVSSVSAYLAPVDNASVAYQILWWGTFVFGLANGTLEAVANPLVATLFPNHRTHYLNILHASWPAGLVIGGLSVYFLGGVEGFLSWQTLLVLFMVPTVFYGFLFFGQAMPKSAAQQSGIPFGEMLRDVGVLGALVICLLLSQFLAGLCKDFGIPEEVGWGIAGALLVAVGVVTRFAVGSWLLFVLFVTHLLVGAVELGTDSWIGNITGNILTPGQGQILFVFTSAVMFALRFCAGSIEKLLSPIGILLVSAVLACIGLNLTSGIATFAGAIMALTVYAVGKTFFWPTMLAVASDRFPRTGAIAISLMGGIGMLSAGIIGGPGLGYAKDRFAGAELAAASPAVQAEYKSEGTSQFLIFAEVHGIDGGKLQAAQNKLGAARAELAKAGETDPAKGLDKLTADERTVIEASIAGDRQTLKADSVIPATMAVIYLLLALWFKAKGGYRALRIEETADVAAARAEGEA